MLYSCAKERDGLMILASIMAGVVVNAQQTEPVGPERGREGLAQSPRRRDNQRDGSQEERDMIRTLCNE